MRGQIHTERETHRDGIHTKDTHRVYIWRRDVYGKRIYADKRDIRRWNIYREGIHTYIYTRRRLGEYVRNRFRGGEK